MTADRGYLAVKEFRELGFLQEVNRCFLHPLGLSLEATVNADGTEALGGIWDYRADPEGMIFGAGMIDPEKIARVAQEQARHAQIRLAIMGALVQPPRWPSAEPGDPS